MCSTCNGIGCPCCEDDRYEEEYMTEDTDMEIYFEKNYPDY